MLNETAFILLCIRIITHGELLNLYFEIEFRIIKLSQFISRKNRFSGSRLALNILKYVWNPETSWYLQSDKNNQRIQAALTPREESNA